MIFIKILRKFQRSNHFDNLALKHHFRFWLVNLYIPQLWVITKSCYIYTYSVSSTVFFCCQLRTLVSFYFNSSAYFRIYSTIILVLYRRFNGALNNYIWCKTCQWLPSRPKRNWRRRRSNQSVRWTRKRCKISYVIFLLTIFQHFLSYFSLQWAKVVVFPSSWTFKMLSVWTKHELNNQKSLFFHF